MKRSESAAGILFTLPASILAVLGNTLCKTIVSDTRANKTSALSICRKDVGVCTGFESVAKIVKATVANFEIYMFVEIWEKTACVLHSYGALIEKR